MKIEFIKENQFKCLSVIPFDLIEQKFPAYKFKPFIPLSYTQVNKLREKKFIEAKKRLRLYFLYTPKSKYFI